ncbi:phenylalanine--tRNA ligase subunit beta [Leptospira perolatii]|uniref:Phenylalanine--tRNA ligase beta subunit n=1 Tax=Leptospira perolatii TaxID=2023191 RepID=A0A2M9ZKV4_9LEPT|nr:phenylalanine--tRNA ligase subunit beta [Leptospira perolatii]PJZ69895.1 phenylalanine--tRNA ligase subunit beta [Leptospira perolatii]PJZ72697.1 phenylalanine--tRNA ligase subunit beta [Leptospira perolatii]
MKLSLDWMNDFVPLKDVPLNDIIRKIAASICELDAAEEFFPHLEKVVLVQIQSVEKHSQADKLLVASVSDGKKKHQIVSGAPNLKVGQIVPLAIPGAVIAGREIKESELRGVSSSGMLCSEKELGLSEEDDGVMVFSESDAKPGLNLREYLGFVDTIFDIDNKSITHRPDLWSHFGFARELAAQLKLPILFHPLEQDCKFSDKIPSPVVRDTEFAHSYFSSRIEGVKIVPSNTKIRSRLKKCGVRVINNVVDVSNYLLLEVGQPTHFFDTAKLESLGGIQLEVDSAKNGESFLLLDDTSPKLDSDLLVIRNAGKPVAIAGVMGGAESAVGDSTKSLILESAVFPRELVRKSIRKTGIRSESSIRYEKGLEATTTLPVIKRTVQLLRENGCLDAEASMPAGYIHTEEKKVVIRLDLDFLNKKLGTKIDKNTVDGILKNLYFSTTWKAEIAEVTVPKFRHNYDITIPEDLVEEVGRSLGYDSIPLQPLFAEVKTPAINRERELERLLKNQFANMLGFNEVYNYSFSSKPDNSIEGPKFEAIEIKNSMPEEQSFLRASLYPSLLKNVRLNSDRFDSIHIFEFGRSYEKSKNPGKDPAEAPAKESKWLAWAVCQGRKWNEKDLSIVENDFLQVRSEIESVLRNLNIRNFSWENTNLPYFHPSANLFLKSSGCVIGELGYAHPALVDQMDLKKRVILGKFDFAALSSVWMADRKINYFKVPSNFPQTEIDLSIVMDRSESSGNFAKLVMKEKIQELSDLKVTVVFTGGNLSEQQKSVTYRFQLLESEKNLTADRIKEITDRLVELAKSSGYSLR